MATRLLPFRQYDDQDVINMYALADAAVNDNVTGVGSGDAGVRAQPQRRVRVRPRRDGGRAARR